ncbi:hypothetical protein LSAT2_005099 [Lamellibrachia satsuma]|nr:hypothetical protein LSAT2_005099 [Lamellibrachia satsuma]
MSDSLSTVTDVTTTQATTMSPDLPLVLGSGRRNVQQRSNVQVLPELPSHRYKYSVWHDISSTEVRGDQLKAPRVRCGPQEKEKLFYRMRNDDNELIHHTKRGRERKDYRHKMENWENAKFCNLSYQELAHGYQKTNFVQVLKRLFRVVELNLLEDNLTDLHGVSFPVCEVLNMSRNYIGSLKKIPKIPRIRHLNLAENNIHTLDGLGQLKQTPIEYLNLTRNPVIFTLNYRQRVFHILPQLKVLDDVTRLDSDDDFDLDQDETTRTCVIS